VNAMWLVPLSSGVVGALALAFVRRRLNRDVAALQKSLRPLRVERSRRPGSPR
jgi:hypothetical protein